MKTSNREFVHAVFSAVDRQDAQAFAGFFAADAGFTFGNNPTVRGPAAIAAYCDQFYGALTGLSHETHDVWQDGDAIIVPATVTYTRKDRSTVPLPCVSVLRMEGGKIRDYRVYMDINPLFA